MRIAFVYDRVNKIGGAETVLAALHELYPESPLFTAVYHHESAPWASGWEVHPSFLNRLPLARSTHELYPWLTPIAFEGFDFGSFDVVVSVTSAEAKGILTQPQTLHVCYCLTPTRYLWHAAGLYRRRLPLLARSLANPLLSYLRGWDRIASQRPDAMIAISRTVRDRIKKYYHRPSQIIYPPVDVNKFQSSTKQGRTVLAPGFFLVVARLVPYKRVDLAIEAANLMRFPLVIIGTGMEMTRLRRRAGPTVRFVGKLTEDDLVLYYQRCRALVFPQEEDFGITAVEAQAAGKPVVAFKKGGATEIIRTGKTGVFFSHQTAASLMQAIRQFDTMNFHPVACKENAKRFDKERFKREFVRMVDEIWKEHT